MLGRTFGFVHSLLVGERYPYLQNFLIFHLIRFVDYVKNFSMKKIWGRDERAYDAVYVLKISYLSIDRERVRGTKAFLDALGLTMPSSNIDQKILSVVDDHNWIHGIEKLDEQETDRLLVGWNGIEGDDVKRCWMPHDAMIVTSSNRVDFCALICFQCDSAILGAEYAISKHRKLFDTSGRTIGHLKALNQFYLDVFQT